MSQIPTLKIFLLILFDGKTGDNNQFLFWGPKSNSSFPIEFLIPFGPW
jgi:hypothetical protein